MFEKSKKNLENLLIEINPLQRMINSDGLNKTFDIIKNEIPNLIIHEYESGSVVEDWIVPKNWSVLKGYLKDKKDKIIASTNDNILFVAPYSESV